MKAVAAWSVWILREQITDDFGYSSLSQRATVTEGIGGIADRDVLIARKRFKIIAFVNIILEFAIYAVIMITLLTSCGDYGDSNSDSIYWVAEMVLATGSSCMGIVNSILTLRAALRNNTPIANLSCVRSMFKTQLETH